MLEVVRFLFIHVRQLDQVLFVPCAHPPHKDPGMLLSGRVRMEMLEAALEGDPRFESCSVELDRGGVSYAVDTLTELTARYADRDLYFIIGDDFWMSPELAEICEPSEAQLQEFLGEETE